MVDSASDSPFGKGTQEVLDPEYRFAKQFKASSSSFDRRALAYVYQPPNMGLSVDIVAPAGLLENIKRELAVEKPLIATLNKVNVYPTGGFFKPHRE